MSGTCPECGLPGIECNAIAIGRRAAERYLVQNGYGRLDARRASDRLVVHPKRT